MIYVVAYVDYDDYYPWCAYKTKDEANEIAEQLNEHDRLENNGRRNVKHWIVDAIRTTSPAMPPKGQEAVTWLWKQVKENNG